MSEVIAAIDCGTNTIKLFIGGPGEQLERESRIVRLGQGVDATGRLAEEALERAFTCLDEYAALIAKHPVRRIRFCATSATRDSSNAAVFADGVQARLGVRPEVLSGEEEATLAFAGAVANLATPHPAPVVVIDVGGGSTEVILGSTSPDAACSMDIGSVRLHERHLHSDPPTAAEIAACTADIDRELDTCAVRVADASSVVGVAGTFLTIAAGALGLTAYDKNVVDQARIPTTAVHELTELLLSQSVAERIAMGFVSAGRADVIGAGALIVSRILRRTSLPSVTASEADILDGIAASIAREM